MKPKLKILISGGGTGGHIFPALSIADEIKKRYADAEMLFVGANNRMEMERVPAAGYKIIGLPVRGLIRKLTFDNVKVILDFLKSLRIAKQIIKDFSPDIAIGVGGYASAPVLRAASGLGVPTLLQEQNSYAGVTNKMLSKKAGKICVAYDRMERFFPAEKIINTGNPVRTITISDKLREEAKKHFGITNNNPVLLVMGGSLGARTINSALLKNIDKLAGEPVEVIWQTGKYYYENIQKELKGKDLLNIHVMDFISRMDLAYNISNLVVSRAGALSLSELCLVGKPSLLVPSPNVAEDHQTKNAMALVDAEAAIMVKDIDASGMLVEKALELLNRKEQLKILGENAIKLAKPEATAHIVDEVMKLLKPDE
jgi:UDP-N-acetylglucosamine--N-acetylmuramyl-(pentapeptide) pyrophosphoryl-undecaprenol N-acetylglucosamine transferase